jgi:hypothetical protein
MLDSRGQPFCRRIDSVRAPKFNIVGSVDDAADSFYSVADIISFDEKS